MKLNPMSWTVLVAACGALIAFTALTAEGRNVDLAPKDLTDSSANRRTMPERGRGSVRVERGKAAPTEHGPGKLDQSDDTDEHDKPQPIQPNAGFASRTSSAGPALQLLREAGFDVPELGELDEQQVEKLDRAYTEFRHRIETVGMERMVKLQTLTRAKFEREECERYTFDQGERQSGKAYRWEEEPTVGHAVRNIGFDSATGMGVARVVRVLPGDYAEVDALDESEKRLLAERQRKLLLILGK